MSSLKADGTVNLRERLVCLIGDGRRGVSMNVSLLNKWRTENYKERLAGT